MLDTFEQHLKQIAAGSNEVFHRQIRKRVGKRATAVLEKKLKNLILLIPKILIRAHQHGTQSAVPSNIKKSIGFALTYFYHPQDLLSDEDGALFGYLDDAYCVGLVYEKILRALVKERLKITDFDRDFLKQFGLIKRAVHMVIPEVARQIDLMVEGIQSGREGVFFNGIR